MIYFALYNFYYILLVFFLFLYYNIEYKDGKKLYMKEYENMKDKTQKNGQNHTSGMRDMTAYYILIYCAASIYIYLPKYLQQGPKLSVEQNGVVQSIGPLVAIIMPFIWGQIADKSKSRNIVWAVVVGGSALTVSLVPLSGNFFYIIIMLAAVSIFQTSIPSLADSVCSEICSANSWDLGLRRRFAPLCYAAFTFLAGAFFRMDKSDIFIAYGLLAAVALIPLLKLPKVPGYRFRRTKTPFYKLFTNKPLLILYCFNFCIFLTSSYYYSFFLLYFTSDVVGGATALYGVCNALASISEFPFLLVVGKIIRRRGVTTAFMIGLSLLALRWLLIGLVPNPYALTGINMLHGFSFACINYCVVIYINQYVQPEFKASGQTFSGIICYGVTKVIGSAAGGWLTGIFGYQAMFISIGVFMALVAAAYALMIPRINRYETQQ